MFNKKETVHEKIFIIFDRLEESFSTRFTHTRVYVFVCVYATQC